MNIVANTPFFTYNGNGKGGIINNAFAFVQNQDVAVANGTYPGYTSAELTPVNGAGVTSYTIYPATATTLPFSATGLNIQHDDWCYQWNSYKQYTKFRELYFLGLCCYRKKSRRQLYCV
jgi:hypothetical protein